MRNDVGTQGNASIMHNCIMHRLAIQICNTKWSVGCAVVKGIARHRTRRHRSKRTKTFTVIKRMHNDWNAHSLVRKYCPGARRRPTIRMPPPTNEPTRKPRPGKPKPYVRNVQKPAKTNAPKTSAHLAHSNRRENLTVHDWMTVFTYMDMHPSMSQGEIVNHFKGRAEGALIFNQSTLSRNWKRWTDLEERGKSNPNGMSSKRPRIVTRPDVERALVLWVKKMEARRETVNGPMLKAKRKFFEEKFNVPEDEQLGEGWLGPFCKAYGLREYRRHGEAGSVDPEAVEAEQKCIQAIMAPFSPRDRFNFDETRLFAL